MWISIAQTCIYVHCMLTAITQVKLLTNVAARNSVHPVGEWMTRVARSESEVNHITSFECRGNLFTQWVNKRHEPIICLDYSKDESQHDSFRHGPIIYVPLTPGVWTKSPSTFFKGDASQVRSWARALQWTHQGDTVQWIKQILLALQLLHVWIRRTSISEQEGKNPLIRRLETT